MPPKSSKLDHQLLLSGFSPAFGDVAEDPHPPAPWTELPRDITANILHRLGAIAILETVQKVCTTWRSVCKDPAMWRVIDMRNNGDPSIEYYELEKMCRHAVDRSQGQLVDINLEYFATNELLDYISERSGKLKRLRLAWCDDVTGEGLMDAVKRFPELEELRIIHFISYVGISNEPIEMVGHSCPLLRTLEFDGSECYRMDDMDAMAIARSMPELRHLQLCGNGLSTEGLEAILDGCPHLESLDIRRCGYVELKGDLLKRCSSQIKCLKYPDEYSSFSDYEDDFDFDEASSYSDYEDDFDFDEDDCESFDGGFPPYPHTDALTQISLITRTTILMRIIIICSLMTLLDWTMRIISLMATTSLSLSSSDKRALVYSLPPPLSLLRSLQDMLT